MCAQGDTGSWSGESIGFEDQTGTKGVQISYGLVPPANLDQLQRAFRSLSRRFHPDKHVASSTSGARLDEAEARARFQAISAAYTQLLARLQSHSKAASHGGEL